MAHDDIPEDEAPPGAIQSMDQARVAAQCVLDYADVNLTKMEGADMPAESCALARKFYDAAAALVAACWLGSASNDRR